MKEVLMNTRETDNGSLKQTEHWCEILLIEDNPADARLTLEALKQSTLECRVVIVAHGEDALALLRCEGRYTAASRPDLIVLDLNLPRMDGHEVLATIKATPALRDIPVIILTTSSAEHDKERSYALGASSFLVKPYDWNAYQDVVKTMLRTLCPTSPTPGAETNGIASTEHATSRLSATSGGSRLRTKDPPRMLPGVSSRQSPFAGFCGGKDGGAQTPAFTRDALPARP